MEISINSFKVHLTVMRYIYKLLFYFLLQENVKYDVSKLTADRMCIHSIKRDRKGVSAVVLGLIILVSAGVLLSFTYTSWLKDIVESYGDYEYLRIFKTYTVKYTEINTFTEYEPYGYVLPITIDYSSGTEDLVGYVLSIELTNSHVFQNSDGSDIWFTYNETPEFTYIPHWIEFWNEQSHRARIWIKFSIDAGQTITIYMHYGAPPPSNLPQWQPENLFLFFEDFNGNDVDETKWYIPEKYRNVDKYEVKDGEIRMYLGRWKKVKGPEKTYFWMDTITPVNVSIAIRGKIAIKDFKHKLFAGIELVLNHDEPFDIELQNPHEKAILAKIELQAKGVSVYEFSKIIIYQDQSSHNDPERKTDIIDLRYLDSIIFEVKYGFSWISIWDNLTGYTLRKEIPSRYQLFDYLLRIGAYFSVKDDQSYVAYDYLFYRFIVDHEPSIILGNHQPYYLSNIYEEEVVKSWKISFKLKNQGNKDIILTDILIDGKPFTKYSQVLNITATDIETQNTFLLYDSLTGVNVFNDDGFKILKGSTVWIEVFITPGGKFQSGRSVEFTFLSFKGHYAIKTFMLP